MPKVGTTSAFAEVADNEPGEAPNGADNTRRGQARGKRKGRILDEAGDDAPVVLDAILRRFEDQAKLGIRASTKKQYTEAFTRFANAMELHKYTRGQLRGKAGRQLLLQYLKQKPEMSWRSLINCIKAVWVYGLQLDYPIEVRRDIGRLPKARRGQTPEDAMVEPWARALKKEPDNYTKLLIMFGLQFGWRPSHIGRLRWQHIQYHGDRPYSIMADGNKEGFKTDSPIGAYLPPSVVEVLLEWRAEHPDPRPQNLILPWRGYTVRKTGKGERGKSILEIRRDRMIDERLVRDAWDRFQRERQLPKLTPRDGRHFVSSATGRADLSDPARALLLGHDGSNLSMPSYYDNPSRNVLIKEQEKKLPNGCLGQFGVTGPQGNGIPPELADLVKQYLGTDMATWELAGHLEAFRLKARNVVKADELLQP